MIYAAADANPYIPIDNLSTAHKHYKTYTNLCSTTRSTLETCCNRQTATDLQQVRQKFRDNLNECCRHTGQVFKPAQGTTSKPDRLKLHAIIPAEPLIILARILYIPFDHTAMCGISYISLLSNVSESETLQYSLTRHIRFFSPTNIKP